MNAKVCFFSVWASNSISDSAYLTVLKLNWFERWDNWDTLGVLNLLNDLLEKDYEKLEKKKNNLIEKIINNNI